MNRELSNKSDELTQKYRTVDHLTNEVKKLQSQLEYAQNQKAEVEYELNKE